MNLDFKHLIPHDFNDNARVWIYQCNRQFTLDETLNIEGLLQKFAAGWLSHGAKVKGFANVFFGQFIIFMADETATGVSGCSTDSSLRVVKNIEQDYNVNLFDRQTLAFIVQQRIQLMPMAEMNIAIENNIINTDTLYFNNTVQTKQELMNEWIISVKNSWLTNRYNFAKSDMLH